MDGKRNLSDEAIGKFATGVRLDNHESEYFKYLVACNQCSDVYRQRVYESKLLYLKELFKVKDLIPELYDYYHDWYHAAIFEMVKQGGMKNDPARIGTSLVPVITESEAQRSIHLLTKLNFISETPDGMLRAEQPTDGAGREVAQKIYQEQMAELATRSIYTQEGDSQGFESVTVSLPAEKVQQLKSKIRDIVEELQRGGSDGDTVYQLNVQLFALTKPTEEEEETASPETGTGHAA